MIHPANTPGQRYMSWVKSIPKLGPDEERELCVRWYEHGDVSARDELVRRYLRLSTALAIKYRRYGIEVDELVAEGNAGLLRALDRFDHHRGLRFLTYAHYWVKAYIVHYVMNNLSVVGGGFRSDSFFRLRRRFAKLKAQMDGDEAIEIMAHESGEDPETMRARLARVCERDVSLDMPLADDSDTGWSATIMSRFADAGTTPDVEADARLNAVCVRKAIAKLSDRERLIIERRVAGDHTLEEVGRMLGVTRERVRQLQARAMVQLRGNLAGLEAPCPADSRA